MTKSFSIPRGTNDILPSEIPTWGLIEQQARQILKYHNYKEIRTPIFEETELFARSIGQTSDIIQKQMLNLAAQDCDAKGHPKLSGMSLRPENTASVVRSYIENHLDRKEPITKLYYIGPMFRGERPQKGRLRQFHQIGAEAIGPNTSSPYLDAEMISLSVSILKAIGLEKFELKINSLGTSECKKKFQKILKEKLKNYLNHLCSDCQTRFERNVLRILDCKREQCKKQVAKLQLNYEWLTDESQKYFSAVKSSLNQLEIKYEQDPHLVRGLDYYTHTVYEISDDFLGAQNALGAGGRYDNLVSELGGPKVDAVGFALGIERIVLSLSETKETVSLTDQIDVFFVVMDEECLSFAWPILHSLRQAGLSSDMSYQITSVKSQMRQANKMNARFCLIIGDEEIKNHTVQLKDMTQGTQEEVNLENNLNHLIDKIKKG